MLINGVSASKICLPTLANPPKTVFEFLCGRFAHIDKNTWQQRFADGLVLSGELRLSVHSPYVAGQVVWYYRHVTDETVVPFYHQVVFENDDILVVDKPHFLTVSPAGRYVEQTLLTRLKQETNNAHLSPLHRLDKDTAGLILISKNPATRHLYHELFARCRIRKVYHAIAPACDMPEPIELSLHLERGEPFYVMRVNPDKPANTHTTISLLETRGDWAKYELIPTTGKLHQLRVHLNHIGLPICHDPFYPVVRHRQADDFSPPLQLLAKELSFTDPITGKVCHFCSSLSLLW
ncbi:MAG: pseudouridine synthase [Moraxella sp.]|nr:pseudouridine synthase [Moraxella sp.]